MRWWIGLVVATAAACNSFPGGGGGGGDDDPTTDAAGSGSGSGSGSLGVFAPSTMNVVVEIDYEAGEQPYTGPMVGFGDTFEPTVTNVGRLFAGTKTVTLPTTVPAMENVGAIADEEITAQDLAGLVTLHRDEHDAAGTKTYYVIFVSGHWTDAQGPNPNVLGVSIGDTIVMFKDVIAGTGSVASPNTTRYVEQSTLIHELAHSIGLVDNGVSMVDAHKDTAHGAHCTNPDCVMYWLNEGAGDASDFAVRRLLTGSTLLFDAKCLADVDALTGGP